MPAIDVDLQRIAVRVGAFVSREAGLDPGEPARGEAVTAVEDSAFFVQNDRMLEPALTSAVNLNQQHHAAQNLGDDDGCDHGVSDRNADHARIFGRMRSKIQLGMSPQRFAKRTRDREAAGKGDRTCLPIRQARRTPYPLIRREQA